MNKQSRLETGNVTPDNDWTGVFIRGDNAMHYSMQLSDILDAIEEDQKVDYFTIIQIKNLVKLLNGCVHIDGIPKNTQFVKVTFLENDSSDK